MRRATRLRSENDHGARPSINQEGSRGSTGGRTFAAPKSSRSTRGTRRTSARSRSL